MPQRFQHFRRALLASALAVGCLFAPLKVEAVDLGIEGTVYETIEEDLRLMMMRLIARTDWSNAQDEMKASARDYLKNLPSYYLPRAEKTVTRWKDIGVQVTEDIKLPYVEWETGSVFEPELRTAIPEGTYLNPIAQLPAAGIERLFIFDATDADQLKQAKELMAKRIPLLSFMSIAGDIGPIAEEMNMPVYHPIPSMLEKFHVRAVPALIGFGRNEHQGHMAITEFKLPVTAQNIRDAWFGYGDTGTPVDFTQRPPEADEIKAFFSALPKPASPAASEPEH